MKRIFLAFASLGLMATMAQAESITLCAGSQGKNYDKVMRAVGIELENRGHTVTIRNLAGSEDILNELAKGTCDFAPAQGDVYYLFTQMDSSFSSTVKPSANLYNEVPQGICTKESGYDELEDLQAGDKIIVDSFGSGSALTWNNMVAIEKKFGGGSSWASAVPINMPLDDATAALGVGEAKCAFGVSGIPAPFMMDGISQDFNIMWIYDKDINDLQFNGGPLYSPIRIPSSSVYESKFDTYKIRAVLFKSAKSKVSKELETLTKRAAQSEGSKKNTVQ